MQKIPVKIGKIKLGTGIPVVQSMTNTDTVDIIKTVQQIKELHNAGSEIVRITVNNIASARAVAEIKKQVGDIPLVGCFHFNGNILLREVPECAKSLDKYRINPGNADSQNFCEMIKIAIKNDKPVRIGVNGGSLDKKIFKQLIEQNAKNKNKKSIEEIRTEAMIASVLQSAKLAESLGLQRDKIVISAKISNVPQLVEIYEELDKSPYVLHLGLTEAGGGDNGLVSSSVALGILLGKNIGDTIRVSITPDKNHSRVREVEICQAIIQSLGLKSFSPKVISCPGCGRTTNTFFQNLAENIEQKIKNNLPLWREKYPKSLDLKIAVMGCVVNGPGESEHANLGISLPGNMEKPIAPVYIDGKLWKNLQGENIAEEFWEIVENYVKENC
jgi:(E)-4-hydroxy-3-methylbut-2-enyl-diphosphate synthase